MVSSQFPQMDSTYTVKVYNSTAADLQSIIINSTIMNTNKKKNINNNKEDDIKLFDNFDWAAMGVAAVGIVVFIHLVVMYIRGV